ncbi:MAG TPA: hypothetical protein V6C72_16795 [Chroococcales cyanobacterium]
MWTARARLAFVIALACCQTTIATTAVSADNGKLRNGLPPTSTDSFVHEAAGQAEHIYGDEGDEGPPPYFGFDYVHRINNGIFATRDQGLTTGHGTYMPSSWGADEFLAPPGEWCQSGANGGNPNDNGAGANLDNEGGDAPPAQANLPPPPGPGYQPMYQHGEFVGWYSPDEITLSQTNFPAALLSVLASGRYYGGVEGAASILFEIGVIDSPFDFAAAANYLPH